MKIKTKKDLDEYLRTNEEKFADPNVSIKELGRLIREQNNILEDWLKIKCKEILNG